MAPKFQELQADVDRQQRVLANVARIQARDRAEEEEMLRIRQQDAQQALIDAASVHAKPEALERSDTEVARNAKQASSSTSTPPTTQDPAESSPAPSTAPNVLPPTFLTPSTPRKGGNTGKFRLPNVDWRANDVAAGAAPASEEKSSIRQKELPYTPSKPVAETESWTPKAIRRGQ